MADGSVFPSARPCIAVVEDDDCLAMVLRYNIEAAGFDVESFSNGLDAVRHLQDSRASLIVLDWGLPGLSGIEVLRRLRAPSRQRVPIIMLTGRSEGRERYRVLTTGADVFLAKPFALRELMASINSLLAIGTALPT